MIVYTIMTNIILYVKSLQPQPQPYTNDFVNSMIIKAWPTHEERQLVGNTLISVGYVMVVICVYLKLYLDLRYER